MSPRHMIMNLAGYIRSLRVSGRRKRTLQIALTFCGLSINRMCDWSSSSWSSSSSLARTALIVSSSLSTTPGLVDGADIHAQRVHTSCCVTLWTSVVQCRPRLGKRPGRPTWSRKVSRPGCPLLAAPRAPSVHRTAVKPRGAWRESQPEGCPSLLSTSRHPTVPSQRHERADTSDRVQTFLPRRLVPSDAKHQLGAQ